MSTQSKTPEYWRETAKRRRKSALAGGLRETNAYVTEANHDKAARLAAEANIRLPEMFGRLIGMGLDALETGSSIVPAFDKPKIELVDPGMIITLTQLIQRSRFPNEPAGTRFKQAGILHLIAAAPPLTATVSMLSKMVGMFPQQMRLIVNTLVERGVLEQRRITSIDRPWAKALSIRRDAVEALQAAHLKATGQEIGIDQPESR